MRLAARLRADALRRRQARLPQAHFSAFICSLGRAARFSWRSWRCGLCWSHRRASARRGVDGRAPGHHGGHGTGDRVVVPGPGAVPLQHAGRSVVGLIGRVAGGERCFASRMAIGALAVLAGVDDCASPAPPGCLPPRSCNRSSPISAAFVPIPPAWRCSKRGRCFSTPAIGTGRSRGCFSAAASTSARSRCWHWRCRSGDRAAPIIC